MTTARLGHRRSRHSALHLISASWLASCAQTLPAPPIEIVPPSAQTATSQVSARDPVRVSGQITSGTGAGVTFIRQDGAGTAVAHPQEQYYAPGKGDISLNYVDADVREIARLILGETLRLNYTIDPGFMGAVTIQTARPLARDALLPALQGLLEQVGGTMTYQNGIFRIGAAADETVVSAVVTGGNVQAGSQIVPLRFASARQLALLLEPHVGDAAKLIVDPSRNVLIVTGSPSARQNVTNLIQVFDVDYLAGQSYALFPAKSGDPNKIAADLEAALQLTDGPLSGTVRIVVINEANAIMVIAQQPAYLDRVARLIAQFDQIKETGGRNIHVYFLRNAQAIDLQPVLQRAVNPPNGGNIGEIAPGNLPPTASPVQVSTTPVAAPTPAPRPPSTVAFASSGAGASANIGEPMPAGLETEISRQDSGANANGPQIIADRANSALIVVATAAEYAIIESAIRKLDIIPMQVLIEATIAEVTLNDALQYGTQFFLSNGEGQVTLSNAVSGSPTVVNPSSTITNAQLFPGLLAANFPGLAVARTLGEQQFAVQALKAITDVQIISAPKLLILDKQQARLQVGDLVPTITQSATSVMAADAPVVNAIQYQATGVILTVTPRINSGGLVTLDIEQEVSDVVPTTSSSINSPTFQQRKIQTKVVVQSGETISLAGLISEKRFKQNSGIPLLQEIPVLGALFSTRTNSSARTELLVLLTPRVLNDQRDARALTEELRRKLAPSALVP
jgi:general secretion pathway protein D